MTAARDLHVRRLHEALLELPTLRDGVTDERSLTFRNWWKGVHHALHALWQPSPYGLQFANIRFQGFQPRRTQRSGPPAESNEDAWSRAFGEAEVVLKRAIEEAEYDTSAVSTTSPERPARRSGTEPLAVFLSRPTWIAPEFKTGHDSFVDLLKTMSLTPRTLGATDYPSKAPLDEVISLMSECQGAIILGYPQISVTTGSIKGMPVNQTVQLPTEWNHIEAGLAHARGLPLLAIHHVGIARGIFDRGAMNAFLYQVDFSNDAWPLQPEIQGALRNWRQSCEQ